MKGDTSAEPDPERINRVLASRQARAACPICDANEWGSPGRLGNVYVLLPGATATEVLAIGDERGGVLAHTLICNNCGFIRLHSKVILDEAEDPGGEPP